MKTNVEIGMVNPFEIEVPVPSSYNPHTAMPRCRYQEPGSGALSTTITLLYTTLDLFLTFIAVRPRY
jgi:hypothetical protein